RRPGPHFRERPAHGPGPGRQLWDLGSLLDQDGARRPAARERVRAGADPGCPAAGFGGRMGLVPTDVDCEPYAVVPRSLRRHAAPLHQLTYAPGREIRT